jgi:uncharacterized cupredoxin-like copper-binding protein
MKQRHVVRAAPLAVGLAALATLAAGCGSSQPAAHASSPTISVEMNAMTFAPSTIEVQSGQTINFRFHNAATVVHEASIGDNQAQDSHEKDMAQMGGSSMGGMSGMSHGDQVQVQPGGSAQLSYHFDHPGTLLIGCHESGHYAAGMRATIVVR